MSNPILSRHRNFVLPYSIVAIVNDGIKSYQALHKLGFHVVTSYKELRAVNWKQVDRLIIQAELNWVNRYEFAQSTYDGYFLLVELLDWAIEFEGTVGFISHHNPDIYNDNNNRLYPFMLKLPCQKVHTGKNIMDFDKVFLMNHYHVVFTKLQHDYDRGFIQLNIGYQYMTYKIDHQKGSEIILVKYANEKHSIKVEGFWGFYKELGRVDLEHEVIEFLRRYFAPVKRITPIFS